MVDMKLSSEMFCVLLCLADVVLCGGDRGGTCEENWCIKGWKYSDDKKCCVKDWWPFGSGHGDK